MKTPERQTHTEKDIRDHDGEKTENSELELQINLSSSTEIEQDTKVHNLRRSKRLTKTNPIVRLNNTVPSEYRKYSQKTERPNIKKGRQHGQSVEKIQKRARPEHSSNNRTTYQLTTWDSVEIYSLEENHIPPCVNSHPITKGGVKYNLEDKLP